MKTAKTDAKSPRTRRIAATKTAKTALRKSSTSPVEATRPPVRTATIDDLRALDEATRDRIVDYVTSGIPIHSFIAELENIHGLRVENENLLIQFYQEEARKRWSGKIEAAAIDADSILNILRNSNMDFSEALLQALGQETFRLITQRELDCKQIERFTRLLLQARAQDFSRQNSLAMLELQRMKVENQVRTQIEKALAALADEIGKYPDARALFNDLCEKLKQEPRDAAPNNVHVQSDNLPALQSAGVGAIAPAASRTSHIPTMNSETSRDSSRLQPPASGLPANAVAGAIAPALDKGDLRFQKLRQQESSL
jgi:hypothetical protein